MTDYKQLAEKYEELASALTLLQHEEQVQQQKEELRNRALQLVRDAMELLWGLGESTVFASATLERSTAVCVGQTILCAGSLPLLTKHVIEQMQMRTQDSAPESEKEDGPPSDNTSLESTPGEETVP